MGRLNFSPVSFYRAMNGDQFPYEIEGFIPNVNIIDFNNFEKKNIV